MSNVSNKTQGVMIFLDVQNLYHSSITFGGSKINYKKLIEKIGENRSVIMARAYPAHRDGKEARNFYTALEKIGVTVIAKRVQIKKINNSQNNVKVIPVHFDVEIAVDAMRYPTEGTDTIVLCTGNGNFEYLVDALVEDGLKVEVWSFKESTSERLIKKAKFVQIPPECLLSSSDETEVEGGGK